MAVMLLGDDNGPALTAAFTPYRLFGLSLLLSLGECVRSGPKG